jgi:hypothetical protein
LVHDLELHQQDEALMAKEDQAAEVVVLVSLALVELAVELNEEVVEAVEVAEAKRSPDLPHQLMILTKKWTPT